MEPKVSDVAIRIPRSNVLIVRLLGLKEDFGKEYKFIKQSVVALVNQYTSSKKGTSNENFCGLNSRIIVSNWLHE